MASPLCTIKNGTPISWPSPFEHDDSLLRLMWAYRGTPLVSVGFKTSNLHQLSLLAARYEPRKQQRPLRRLRHRMPGWRWWPWSPWLVRFEDHMKRDIWCYSAIRQSWHMPSMLKLCRWGNCLKTAGHSGKSRILSCRRSRPPAGHFHWEMICTSQHMHMLLGFGSEWNWSSKVCISVVTCRLQLARID